MMRFPASVLIIFFLNPKLPLLSLYLDRLQIYEESDDHEGKDKSDFVKSRKEETDSTIHNDSESFRYDSGSLAFKSLIMYHGFISCPGPLFAFWFGDKFPIP
jgi:hypothetical protein